VVFILLVFFMLTTRLLPVDYLELGNNTDSRGTATGDPLPELIINADGSVRWQENDYTLDQLMPALANADINEANIRAAAQARLANFTRTLSALDSNGIQAHWKRDPGDS
ncbi:MAG: ferric siderophore transport system innermembrane protein E, partial [Marinobacter sp. T13-3]